MKIIEKKISNSITNMKLIEENLKINENEIKKQIYKENHEKGDVDYLNIKAKADYDLVKKDMEDIINKTRIKYGESQDKVINAQKSLNKLNLHLKKLNKLYDNLMNPRKLSHINKKETKRRKETIRRKTLFINKINELDVNKINTNLNNNENNQKEKNIITNSTSPTIHDIGKQTNGKIQYSNTINK